MQLDGARSLAWRLRRHALHPTAGTTVVDIARRVVALRGWPLDLADMAMCVRQSKPDPGGIERALSDGDLARSYAFRGGSYVFTHENAAVLLSARTATRIWETSRWQKQGGFAIDDWEPLRDAVHSALAAGPLTRAEISAHLERVPSVRGLAVAAGGAGADSLYKPLHWWGDICFGPTRDGQATFRRLRDDPRWPGLPDVDEAVGRAITLYLGAYGPATMGNLVYWLTEGLGVPRRRLVGWISELGDTVTAVTVDGEAAYVLTADLDRLSTTESSDVIRLLPGFDPWVMGPGTADARILSPQRRAVASRGANLVIRGGVVTGTWRVTGRQVTVSWFSEAGPAPEAELAAEVRRVADIRGQELDFMTDRA